MIKTQLFHKLKKAFQKFSSIKGQEDFFLYLARKEGELIGSATVSRFIQNKTPLDKESLTRIQSNNDWSSGDSPFARLIRNPPQGLHEDIYQLHREYLPEVDIPTSCNDALGNLVRLCFSDDYQRHECQGHDLKLRFCQYKKRRAKRMVIRNNLIKKLKTALAENGMVVVQGEAGIGKTCLIQHFDSIYRGKTFDDYFCITYQYSLDDTIRKIQFEGHNANRDNWELLSLKSPDSLLVIDDMDCPPEKMEEELDRLSGLKLNVIAVTRTAKLPARFPVISVDPMDDGLLSQLCIKAAPDSFKDENSMQELFEIFNRNTLAVSLTAKLADKAHYTAEKLVLILKNSKFGLLKKEPKYHHDYSNADQKYHGHICHIYKHYRDALDEDDCAKLAKLSILGNAPIPCATLSGWIEGADDEWIQSMEDLGFLSEITPGIVRMHRLIADAILLTEKPNYRSCRAFISAIHGSVTGFQHDLSLPNIQGIVHESVSRLLPTITGYNNAGQKSPSKEQERWWLYVLDCVIYLLSLGESECSAHMLQDIYAIKGEAADLSHPYYLFKMTLDMHNDWVSGRCIDELISSLNGLQTYIFLNKDNIRKDSIGCHSAALGYLMVTVIDKCAMLAFRSMLPATQRQSLTESNPIKTIHKGFQLPHGILKLFTQHIQSLCIYAALDADGNRSGPCLSFLSGDSYEYYEFLCEYLSQDSYDQTFLSSLTERMFAEYNFLGEALPPSVRIRYICAMMIFQAVCIALNAINGGDIAAHSRHLNNLQLLKSRLDIEISEASLLTKTIFNMSVTAYYHYAFCLSDAKEDISAREKAEECFAKTPNLSAVDKKTVMDGFSKLFKTDLSRSLNAPLPDL